jgi:hypothetical protein
MSPEKTSWLRSLYTDIEILHNLILRLETAKAVDEIALYPVRLVDGDRVFKRIRVLATNPPAGVTPEDALEGCRAVWRLLDLVDDSAKAGKPFDVRSINPELLQLSMADLRRFLPPSEANAANDQSSRVEPRAIRCTQSDVYHALGGKAKRAPGGWLKKPHPDIVSWERVGSEILGSAED